MAIDRITERKELFELPHFDRGHYLQLSSKRAAHTQRERRQRERERERERETCFIETKDTRSKEILQEMPGEKEQ